MHLPHETTCTSLGEKGRMGGIIRVKINVKFLTCWLEDPRMPHGNILPFIERCEKNRGER